MSPSKRSTCISPRGQADMGTVSVGDDCKHECRRSVLVQKVHSVGVGDRGNLRSLCFTFSERKAFCFSRIKTSEFIT